MKGYLNKHLLCTYLKSYLKTYFISYLNTYLVTGTPPNILVISNERECPTDFNWEWVFHWFQLRASVPLISDEREREHLKYARAAHSLIRNRKNAEKKWENCNNNKNRENFWMMNYEKNDVPDDFFNMKTSVVYSI